MKDMTRKIRSKAWMDAENRWWVADLLAQTARRRGSTRKKKKKQCQSSIVGLENGKKEDEKRKMEEMHQQKVSQMIKKCRRWCWAFTQAWRGGVQILKEIAEDAKLLDRCEAKKKNGQERHWQCGEVVQNMEDKPWKKEELKRMRWLPPKSPPGSDNTNDGKIVEFLEKVEGCRNKLAQRCYS